MSLELRSVVPDEIESFVRAEARGFGGHAIDAYIEHGKSVIEPKRALAMFDGETVVETLRVPRDLYDEIAADKEGWQALRDQVSASMFVDMHRLVIGE